MTYTQEVPSEPLAKILGEPQIIQGGMGVAVSGWRLARAVSGAGQLGVVSSTGIDAVLVRRLQLGDPDGDLRRAFASFPCPEMADRIWTKYFVTGGKRTDRPFIAKPIFTYPLTKQVVELVVLANFVEVFLAKEGHAGRVGINLLEKIQIATLPSLLGAMLANVDYVLMGAGIPRDIPGVLDRLAACEEARLLQNVAGNAGHEDVYASLNPRDYFGTDVKSLLRPKFLAIVSSSVLATTLARKSTPPPDGFVIEASTAGGHNAPPRGAVQLDETGQPIYGPRDLPDLADVRNLGLPFWMAGSFGTPSKLGEALQLGACGIQIGTPFAFCDESGIDPAIKAKVLDAVRHGNAVVYTDPKASPTGFPFKVLNVEGTLSESNVYDERERVCDLGYLRQIYRKKDGRLGYRCPAEPVDDYLAKGGDEGEAFGRKCLCNGLVATIGLGQVRKNGDTEPPIVTAGDMVNAVAQFLKPGAASYRAQDVLDALITSTSIQQN